MDIPEPANQKEEKFVTKTFLQAAENVEMTDQDVEIAENHGTEFNHDALMEYSNIQLDFIKVFGERVFVMVIGKPIIKHFFTSKVVWRSKYCSNSKYSTSNSKNFILVMPAYDVSLWDFLKFASTQKQENQGEAEKHMKTGKRLFGVFRAIICT